MTALDDLGRDRFRATVSICPKCLSLYDGSWDMPTCEDGAELEVCRVRIDLACSVCGESPPDGTTCGCFSTAAKSRKDRPDA